MLQFCRRKQGRVTMFLLVFLLLISIPMIGGSANCERIRRMAASVISQIDGSDSLFSAGQSEEPRAAEVRTVNPTCPLLTAQRQELERKAVELGIADSVTFTGYLDNPYACLSRCDLYVNASDREGFSTAVVESLLCGTPVCAVDVGGMKEILGENNEFGVVTENDDESLYSAIRHFLTDESFRDRYRQQARKRSVDFNSDNAVKKVEDLLLSI